MDTAPLGVDASEVTRWLSSLEAPSAEAVQREGKRRGLLAADHDPEADVAKIGAAGLAGLPAL